jgi:hypothetical protein
MPKNFKKQVISNLKDSISKNLLAVNLTFLQKADFINDAYKSSENFITNQAILSKIKSDDKYDGMTLLLSISPSTQEALEIAELLNATLENLHFVPDPGKVLTYLYNNMEI